MARSSPPTPYTPSTTPILAGGDDRYLQEELARIQTSITSLVRMCPQVATTPPKEPADGMVRLSRSPWRPIGGTVDAWVYYDAASTSWKAL